MAWRFYAIDATLSPWQRRLDGVEAHEGPRNISQDNLTHWLISTQELARGSTRPTAERVPDVRDVERHGATSRRKSRHQRPVLGIEMVRRHDRRDGVLEERARLGHVAIVVGKWQENARANCCPPDDGRVPYHSLGEARHRQRQRGEHAAAGPHRQ